MLSLQPREVRSSNGRRGVFIRADVQVAAYSVSVAEHG
jgi:hypothetical protein